jgi:DNA-binding NtrC family response regulator
VEAVARRPAARVLAIYVQPVAFEKKLPLLAANGVDADLETDLDRGVERAGRGDPYDVILVDSPCGSSIAVELVQRLRELGVISAVVVLGDDNTAAAAAAGFRAGAFHYLCRPIQEINLLTTIEAAAHQTALRRRMRSLERGADQSSFGSLLVGKSVAIQQVRETLERLAQSKVSVLIQGESGTGKELAARALHSRGPRRERRFVPLNCSAIPEGLIDTELFGHARGAFTGATDPRPGLFVEADGGTLFLDEIGDMPLGAQAHLLRTLQDGEVRPVGGTGSRAVDVRVIAATNVDLARAVDEKRFRKDLFFRFNAVTLWLPPLRDRAEDIPLLAAHILHKHREHHTPELTAQALEALMSHSWPGNVRELENALLHAIAMHGGPTVDVDALPPQIRGAARLRSGPMPVIPSDEPDDLPMPEARRLALASFERTYLTRVMKRAAGNVSEASRLSGLDRANLRRLLQRHGLSPAQFRDPS